MRDDEIPSAEKIDFSEEEKEILKELIRGYRENSFTPISGGEGQRLILERANHRLKLNLDLEKSFEDLLREAIDQIYLLYGVRVKQEKADLFTQFEEVLEDVSEKLLVQNKGKFTKRPADPIILKALDQMTRP